MKTLLITSVYENEVVGPARFARLLEADTSIDVDVLTSNVEETKTLKSVPIRYAWWERKLKILFSRKHFSKRINELKEEYDVLLYNSSVLVDYDKIKSPFIVMVNDEKLANLKFSFRFDFIRRFLHRRVERQAVRKAEKVIVNSKYMKAKIALAYGVDQDKIHVLYKGISLLNKRASFQDTLGSKEVIKVLFVKNDFILGGLIDLVQALGEIESLNFVLTIVGTSEKVEKILNEFPNVSYSILGYQPNDRVIQEMYQSDILCIPSQKEPLGVAVMEGLAVGVPTITTGVGGLPEVTQNGSFVWQCDPRDPKSIAFQLEECINKSDLRRIKSKDGKRFVHETFDFETIVSRLNEILKK